MKLKHITFTGVDERTSPYVLESIQQEFPYVEFGILMSRHWGENGNRYPSPSVIERFLGQGLNLSAHLCGGIAKDAFAGNLISAIEASEQTLLDDDFKRVQLNIAPYKVLQIKRKLNNRGKEIIIQQKSPNREDMMSFMDFYRANPQLKPSMLIDPSGGLGRDTGLDIAEIKTKVGYAGGINAQNVDAKLRTLMNLDTVGDFWIDMESGVRTDDWFDTDKVVEVLRICRKVLQTCEV